MQYEENWKTVAWHLKVFIRDLEELKAVASG